MKKQLLALLLAWLLMMSTTVLADTTITVTGAQETTLPETILNLYVTWLPTATGYRCVMTWQANGNDYEAAITGLGEQLTDEQVSQLLYAWSTRSHAVIEGKVVDAEKFTSRLGWNTGDWLVSDTEERSQERWGDTSMCWAATSANMLWNSGWAQKAINPLTGAAFTSEDDVFALFKQHFINDGGWSDHGVRWFFTGKADELDLHERWEDTNTTRLEGFDPANYLHGTMNQDNPSYTVPATMEEFVSIVRRIRDGATVGMSVGFNEEYYHMPDNENNDVFWSAEHQYFYRSDILNVTKEECRYSAYCYDDEGDAVLLTEQADGSFVDDNGNVVDRLWVLMGYLYSRNGQWWYAEPFGEEDLLVSVEIPLDDDAFDHNDMNQMATASHQHAITLTGYVMNLSASDPGDMIEAMFIANSDDDGALWHIYPDTSDSAHRPNIYQMYPTSIHACDEGPEMRTICLEQFMAHRLTLVNNVVALDAAE